MRADELELKSEVDRYGPSVMIGDFGFCYPLAFVESTVAMLKLSNWTCWPFAGTWADQPSSLISDVRTYLKVYNPIEKRVKWEVENNYQDKPPVNHDQQKRRSLSEI